MFRRMMPIVGLVVAGIWTGPAWAQVNIDQGKSAAEMFNGDCATCHKSPRGLANGRNSGALAGFLREHYTSSAQQAATLAAYVLGAGAGPAPSANLKPGTGGAEPKTGEAKAGEAKPGEKPAAGKREPRPVTASRGPRQEPETPPPAPEATPMATPEPASVATAPAEPESAAPATPQPALPATAAVSGAVPESGSAPNASMPSGSAASGAAPDAGASGNAAATAEGAQSDEGAPAENMPVPRDDIPD